MTFVDKRKTDKNMETKFASSELVLAEDNTPYHIRIKPETLADKVILVGDPARAELISKRFDKISAHTSNREIVSYSGTYKSKPLTVLSTGMGVGCIDIVINELDICANVNLETKQPNPSHRSLDLIRIGTCGSLQDELEVGMCVASAFAIGTDGLGYYYKGIEKINEAEMVATFCKQVDWKPNLPTPYAIGASKTLLDKIAFDIPCGITLTAAGFYAPQGRKIRLSPADETINQRLKGFSFNNLKITNYEMETSALYGLGRMCGHNVLTICNVIAGRTSGKFSKDYHKSMDDLIDLVLERL